ncbi:hypothetical protein LCGC14_1676460, partial [marine sediment metagenome]
MDIEIASTAIGILGTFCVLFLVRNRKIESLHNRIEFRLEEIMKKLHIAERKLEEEKREHETSKRAAETTIKDQQKIIDDMIKKAKKPNPG